MAKKDLKLYLEMEVRLKIKGFAKFLQIRKLELIIFVGNLDTGLVLHLFWILKEKSQLQNKIPVCKIKKIDIFEEIDIK